jgi:hypothetical protein
MSGIEIGPAHFNNFLQESCQSLTAKKRTRGRSINNQELWLSGHFLIVGNGVEGKN